MWRQPQSIKSLKQKTVVVTKTYQVHGLWQRRHILLIHGNKFKIKAGDRFTDLGNKERHIAHYAHWANEIISHGQDKLYPMNT